MGKRWLSLQVSRASDAVPTGPALHAKVLRQAAVALALVAACAAASAVAGTPASSSTFRVGLTLVASCRVGDSPAGMRADAPGVSCTAPRPHAVSVAPGPLDPGTRALVEESGAPPAVPGRLKVVTLTF